MPVRLMPVLVLASAMTACTDGIPRDHQDADTPSGPDFSRLTDVSVDRLRPPPGPDRISPGPDRLSPGPDSLSPGPDLPTPEITEDLVSDPGGLTIYPENPRYFIHQGRVAPLISVAETGIPSAESLAAWEQAGLNQVREVIMTDTDHSNPYLHTSPASTNVDNRWGGWDEAYWNGLRERVGRARDHGFVVFVVVFSSPMLLCWNPSCGANLWAVHLWNEANGGPLGGNISPPYYGKPKFYSLWNYDGFQFGNVAYDEGWIWKRKNQYRQEELLARLVEALPRSEFPNWAPVLMWEMQIHWGELDGKTAAWGEHMVAFLRSLEPTLPVGLGTYHSWQLEEGGADFGLVNGFSFLDSPFEPPQDAAVVYEGYHPRPDCYVGSDDVSCVCFDGAVDSATCGPWDDASCTYQRSANAIRSSLLAGIQASMPFGMYWHSFAWDEQACKDAGRWDYDRAWVQEQLLAYTTEVRAALTQVTDWSDEPGDELVDGLLPVP